MKVKNNFEVEGTLKIGNIPLREDTLSVLLERNGEVNKRLLGSISLENKEAYIPGLSLSFPSIFNLNTQSLDYNNRSLTVSLANQMQGTVLMAPPNLNGTPAFRKIVKSDLDLANVIFTDDPRIPNWNITYTSSLGINKVGNDFRPVYGNAVNTIAQGNDSRINNGQTAFGWGNYRDYGLGKDSQTLVTSGIDGIFNSGLYSIQTSTIGSPTPGNSGTLLSMVSGASGGLARGELFISGNNLAVTTAFIRMKSTTGTPSSWQSLWTSADFTQTDIDSWRVNSSKNFLSTKNSEATWMTYEAFDFDNPSGASAMSANTSSLNQPLGKTNVWSVLNIGGSLNTLAQIAISTSGSGYGNTMVFRERNTAPWKELWHSSNFNPSNYVPYLGATSNVHLNGQRLLGVLDLSVDKSNLSWPNAINNDPLAWNRVENELLRLTTNNNALAFIGNSTFNARTFGIQVGHTTPSNASATGVLDLQPMHGQVRIGSLRGVGDRMVVADSTGMVGIQEIPTIPTNYVTKNNDSTISLATTVLDLNSATTGASILYAGASSTNLPTGITGTAGGVLITANHPAVGTSQMYIARGENDALLYRNQSGNWNRVASRDWTNAQGFVKTDTTYDIFSKTTNGLVPAPTGTTSTRFLREDDTWVIPTNTTYSVISEDNIKNPASTVGGLLTGQRLDQWWQTKAVLNTQIFEKTAEGGLRVKEWFSIANKNNAIAIGNSASATSLDSLALMVGASVSGLEGIAIGPNTQVKYSGGISIGRYSVDWSGGNLLGDALINNMIGCTIVGKYNNPIITTPTSNNTDDIDQKPIFIIGNGISSILRGNSHVFYRDGSTRNYGRQYYDEATRDEIDFTKDNTLVDVQYVRENSGGGGTDFSYKTVLADYLVTDDDHAKILVPTTTNITITFPNTLKEAIYVRVDNASNGEVNIVAPNTTGDIVGTSPYKLVMNGEMVYYRVNSTIRRIKGDFIF